MAVHATTATPEKMFRMDGTWRLELEQLVYKSACLLRPRRFAVLGEDAILNQLRKRREHEALAREAERLFSRPLTREETYLIRDGQFVVDYDAQTVAEPEPVEEQDASSSVAAVEEIDALTQRIGTLEATIRELKQALLLSANSQSSSKASKKDAPPAKAAGPAPAVNIEESDTPSINLPSVAAISDIVRSLAGDGANLSADERFDWSASAATGTLYYSVIVTNDGEEVGAVLFDLESALRLSGALLMESDDVVSALLEERVMSDEMSDATSEVANTIMSCFNKTSGNPHLKAGKILQADEERLAWLSACKTHNDYRYSVGGYLSTVAR